MSITYRKLKQGDAVNLRKLRLSVMDTDPYSFSVTKSEEQQASLTNIESAIESYRLSNERLMLGAWNDDLAGVVGIERYENEIERHKVRLWGPYVTISNREIGIGSRLIKEALNFAFSIEGVEITTLETISESNSAISLFIKNGFEKTGAQNKGVRFGNKYADILYMQKNK